MIQVFPTVFPPQNVPVIDQKGTVTNAFMAFFRDLYNMTGAGTGLPNQVTVSATGSLTADWNLVTSAAASPVTLPSLTGGQMVVVQNNTGLNLTVKAPTGATIDGVATYTLLNTKMQIYWFFSASQIFSTQLG